MKARLANDVYRCCFHHALSSQAEEVMGILIGEKIIEKDVGVVIESKFNYVSKYFNYVFIFVNLVMVDE